MTAPRVLFLNHCPPGPGVGSPVIIDRHLRRLADAGWSVSSACLEDSLAGIPISRPDWTVVPLPYRRWWWPPFRRESALALALRAALYAREIRAAHPPGTRFAALFTVLNGQFASIGTHLARRFGAPLHVFAHDYFEPAAPGARAQQFAADRRVLAGAERVWAVSDAMGEWLCELHPGARTETLPPIPENALAPDAPVRAFRTPAHFVYAGYLHDSAVPALEEVARALAPAGGRLTVIGRHSAAAETRLAALGNVTVRGYFPSNHDVVDFLAREATAFVVTYEFDDERSRWVRTCFPSKLPEFAATGVPALILAPASTPVAAWARARGWNARAEALGAPVSDAVAALLERGSWERHARLMRAAAQEEFHPDRIHARLAAALPAGAPR